MNPTVLGFNSLSSQYTPLETKNLPATIVANYLSGTSITINGHRSYTLLHDGEDEGGNSAGMTVYIAISGTPITSPSSGLDKLKLMNGRAIVIGPYVDQFSFRTATGSVCFTLIPSELVGGYLSIG